MAGAGYKAFADGDVLTAAQVQTYLQDQAVMRFADSSARTSALGGSVAEGMVSYLQDTNAVEVYDGSAWVVLGGGFTASTAITTTDASWSVPTLADPVVRVTVVGGGGGAGAGWSVGNVTGWGTNGTNGSSSSFACSAGTVTADGGALGIAGEYSSGWDGDNEWRAMNNGRCGDRYPTSSGPNRGQPGRGGKIVVGYLDLTGVSTASVTCGAGGTGGTPLSSTAPGAAGGDGGQGFVIFEYLAG